MSKPTITPLSGSDLLSLRQIALGLAAEKTLPREHPEELANCLIQSANILLGWLIGANCEAACEGVLTHTRLEADPQALTFLLDRLSDFENDIRPSDSERDWHGHVAPAIARVKASLNAVERSDPSQDGEGARYGVPVERGQSAVTPCRAWFNALSDARAWAEAYHGEVWDLVTGKRVA